MCEKLYETTEWIKYKNINGLPSNVSVEICEKPKGESEPFKLDYSKLYFLDEDINEIAKKNELSVPPSLQQVSRKVENKIYKDAIQDTINSKDIIRILAWKVGKINHKEGDNNKFEYHKGWSDDENNMSIQFRTGDKYNNTNGLNELLCGVKKLRNKKGDELWKGLLKESKGFNGLGTVYLITLLHFLTKGAYPIYDKFAMASLVVWKLQQYGIDVPRESIIYVGSLPDKTHKDVSSLLDTKNNDSMYKKYIGLLNEFCSSIYGEENEEKWKFRIKDGEIKNYDDARNIDRALWVYGHFFEVRQ